MRPKRYSSEAVVLNRMRFGEADRILTVFSKNYGKLVLIAKGIRKPKSRKRGSLEIFSSIKFVAARGKNMDVITDVEIINNFEDIRKNLKRVSVAYFLVEVVNKLTREEESNKNLYFLLLNYLKKLRKEKYLRNLRNKYIKDVLVLLGYWPRREKLIDPDGVLEEATERELSSKRVGKIVLR